MESKNTKNFGNSVKNKKEAGRETRRELKRSQKVQIPDKYRIEENAKIVLHTHIRLKSRGRSMKEEKGRDRWLYF